MVLVIGTAVMTAVSQTGQAQKPSFEVVSIRLNSTGRNASVAVQPGGRFVASQTTLRRLLQFAYRGHQDFTGGPDWLDTDRWDIEAKAAEGAAPARAGLLDFGVPDTTALMVQSLLEDRFKLVAHTETRELPIYELTLAKSGLKMKLSEDQTPAPSLVGGGGGRRGGSLPRGGISIGGSDLEIQAQPVSLLALALGAVYAGRPVVDKTGLKGLYDIKLQWTPDTGLTAPTGPGVPPTAAAPSGPSLAAAIEEQLGLHLQPARGPLPVLVIDSVQRPTEN